MLPAQAPIRVEVFAAQGASGNAAFVKSANFTAANDAMYHTVATCTVTDPTPVEGKGFEVFVRNGTATVGGVAYSRAGTRILRVYHSGAWASYPTYSPVTVADIPTLSDGTALLSVDTITGTSVYSNAFRAAASSTVSLFNSSNQACLQFGSSGNRNLTIPAGTAVTFSATSYTFGTGAASAFGAALALSSANINFNSAIATSGLDSSISTTGESSGIFTTAADSHISTTGGGFIQTSSTFKLSNGTYKTTLSHAPTADNAIAFPDASGTVALIPTGPYADDAAAATGGVPVGYLYYTAAGAVIRRMA